MGGVSANCLLALLVAGVFLLRGQRQLALMAILLALGGGLLDVGLKEFFRRPRPASPADWVTERNYSFPSGHSMGSVIGYGLLVYLLVLPLAQRLRTRVAVLVGVALLVGLIGFSRIYLRAHYVSDVLAGFAAGIVWLAICITILNSLRQRSQLRDDLDLTPARAGAEFLGLQLKREEVLSELSLPAKTL
jgi:undecaprenyl-diphosphatase